MKLYVLTHIHVQENESENKKIIGIYSSERLAIEAVDRLKNKPGFQNHNNIINHNDPDYPYTSGFEVSIYILNEDNWKEGYFTYKY